MAREQDIAKVKPLASFIHLDQLGLVAKVNNVNVVKRAQITHPMLIGIKRHIPNVSQSV